MPKQLLINFFMKKEKFISILFAIAISGTFFSCSNENITEPSNNDTTIKAQSNDVSIKKNLPTDGIVKRQFDDYLSHKNTRSANMSTWDFNNIVEFSSANESIYCYMIADKNDPNKILGGCSTAKDIITTFFTFEKNGELYTLKDELNRPIADVKLDLEHKQILFINTYTANSQTRASYSEWCGLGMGLIGVAFAPATLGASIGFAACWGVVSALMCR